MSKTISNHNFDYFFRVATCEATKMSIENLALVFGPTIMGYSSHEIDECTFRAESSVQKDVSSFEIHISVLTISLKMFQLQVLEKLLTIPTDYWARFITIESDSENEKVSVHSFFGKSVTESVNSRRRKFKSNFFV